MPRYNTPVCIKFVSYRHRLADIDGVSYKALLDGIVKANILESDTTEKIKQCSYEQVKISKKEQEKTVVEIIPIN